MIKEAKVPNKYDVITKESLKELITEISNCENSDNPIVAELCSYLKLASNSISTNLTNRNGAFFIGCSDTDTYMNLKLLPKIIGHWLDFVSLKPDSVDLCKFINVVSEWLAKQPRVFTYQSIYEFFDMYELIKDVNKILKSILYFDLTSYGVHEYSIDDLAYKVYMHDLLLDNLCTCAEKYSDESSSKLHNELYKIFDEFRSHCKGKIYERENENFRDMMNDMTNIIYKYIDVSDI